MLETKVGNDNLIRVSGNIWKEWEYDNNNRVCSNRRIWVGWNKEAISIDIKENFLENDLLETLMKFKVPFRI